MDTGGVVRHVSASPLPWQLGGGMGPVSDEGGKSMVTAHTSVGGVACS